MRYGILMCGLGVFAFSEAASAGIPEPDAILYGRVIIGGQVIPATETNMEIYAKVIGRSEKIGSYFMGDHEAAGDRYVLRMKLESVPTGAPPRSLDAALIGETARVFVKRGNQPEVQMLDFVLSDRGIIEERDLASCVAAGLTASAPASQGSLWRSGRNIIRVNFSPPLPGVPSAGSILIQELLPSGAFGPDLSASFTFSLENGGSVLKIRQNGNNDPPSAVNATTLQHRKWYAVRNVAGDCITDFELQFVVQVGDADANRFVTAVDTGQVNASPGGAVADNSRFDIDGNGFRTAVDVGLANAGQGGLPPKPSGH